LQNVIAFARFFAIFREKAIKTRWFSHSQLDGCGGGRASRTRPFAKKNHKNQSIVVKTFHVEHIMNKMRVCQAPQNGFHFSSFAGWRRFARAAQACADGRQCLKPS
jgi:hypothetical protein